MKRISRCRWDKKIGGVFGGLGQYVKIDPNLLRLFYLTIMLFTFVLPGVVLYLLAWLIMPLGPVAYVQIKAKKLYRSVIDRKIAGVCGGLAEFFIIDPTIFRIAYIIALFATGIFPLIIVYIAAMSIIPERNFSANRY